jgi:predicted enzyme related to lactoylglutathione lyase
MAAQQSPSNLNFNSVLIGTNQPEVLATFYEKVLGRPADWSDGGYYGWQVGSGFLTVGEHSEVQGQAKEPARIILNFETPAVQAEYERIRQAQATVIREPYELGGGWIATLADPDGNYIQLVSPM